jgi:hypothetical protein
MPELDDETKELFLKVQQCLVGLRAENIGDFIYTIREHELKGWKGPRVVAYGQSCAMIGPLIEAIDERLKGGG